MAEAEAGAKASNYPYLQPSWQSQNLLILLDDKLQRGWLYCMFAPCECTMLSLEMRLWQNYRAVSLELIKYSSFFVELSPLLFAQKWKKSKPLQNSSIWTTWQKESIHISQWAAGLVFLPFGDESQHISVNRQWGLVLLQVGDLDALVPSCFISLCLKRTLESVTSLLLVLAVIKVDSTCILVNLEKGHNS